ncbi:MAG TPA: ADP-ribosylglycohydrolase family protein, partial [Phycisphaerae bacterium]|nr:ADP-ribosylglycohydrolase family protein [Phycisphaerae bacterium]
MAVGDALGLPREGMSARRAAAMWGGAPLRHRFLFGRGMISDDTVHACMTAQALLASRGDLSQFGKSLAWRLRGWLLGAPAGIGFGTLRAILKLWMGFSPTRSGVRSAGNGAAMRATILGVWAAARRMNAQDRRELVRISTAVTHRDERAEEGAWVIAETAAWAATGGGDPSCLLDRLQAEVEGDELRRSLSRAKELLAAGATTKDFVVSLGLARGVTGYINHTVPVVLFCFLRWPNDFRRAVTDAILVGGDSDTIGGVVGSLTGAAHGLSAIPPEWLEGMWEWPRSVMWIQRLGQRMANAVVDGSFAPLPLF